MGKVYSEDQILKKESLNSIPPPLPKMKMVVLTTSEMEQVTNAIKECKITPIFD